MDGNDGHQVRKALLPTTEYDVLATIIPKEEQGEYSTFELSERVSHDLPDREAREEVNATLLTVLYDHGDVMREYGKNGFDNNFYETAYKAAEAMVESRDSKEISEVETELREYDSLAADYFRAAVDGDTERLDDIMGQMKETDAWQKSVAEVEKNRAELAKLEFRQL